MSAPEFIVEPQNGELRRLVTSVVDGKQIHVDRIDPYSSFARDNFVKAISARYSDPRKRLYFEGGESSTETTLSDKLLRAAEKIDEQEIVKLANALPVFQRITCPELDAAEYFIEYLARWILTAGQPCIFAGGKKCLKTSLLVALAIALATARPFLGTFVVPRAVRVLMMTGESGMATIQETARRVARSMGLELSEIGNLIFSPDLPRFGSEPHCEALEKMLTEDEISVLMVDPAFLCMPTEGSESSLFAMGELLRGMIEVCQRCGVTLILAHHTKKGVVNPYAPPELEDIAFAGFQEMARQWILVSRRERYEPGTGEHRLWLNCGGSAGHSSCHALNISEGAFDGATPRHWSVEVLAADEARQDVDQRQEQAKAVKTDEQRQKDKQAILRAAAKFPAGETMTAIRDTSGIRNPRFGVAFSELLSDGELVPSEITKGNSRPYQGYKLGGDQ